MRSRVLGTVGGSLVLVAIATVVLRGAAGIDGASWAVKWTADQTIVEVFAGFGLAAWILAFERLLRDVEVDAYLSDPHARPSRVIWLLVLFAPIVTVGIGVAGRDGGLGLYGVVAASLFNFFFAILWVPNPSSNKAGDTPSLVSSSGSVSATGSSPSMSISTTITTDSKPQRNVVPSRPLVTQTPSAAADLSGVETKLEDISKSLEKKHEPQWITAVIVGTVVLIQGVLIALVSGRKRKG